MGAVAAVGVWRDGVRDDLLDTYCVVLYTVYSDMQYAKESRNGYH